MVAGCSVGFEGYMVAGVLGGSVVTGGHVVDGLGVVVRGVENC